MTKGAKKMKKAKWNTRSGVPMRDWKGRVPTLADLQPHGDDEIPRDLRAPQRDGYERAKAIVDGECLDATTVAAVAPGGGKTLLAAIFAQVLIRAGYVSRVIIVAPRETLREQVRKGFCEPVRGLDLQVTEVATRVSKRDMFATAGVVTTYQAAARSSERLLAELATESFLLILDEVHHLADTENVGWVSAIKRLVGAARHTLCMSGNLERGDRRRVPFVTYLEQQAVAHIRYTRREALAERAIIPLDVELIDGDTKYFHKGAEHDVTLSTAPTIAKRKKAIRTALKTDEYRDRLLTRGIDSWLEYRETYYRSQMIIVCTDQAEAKDVAKVIRAGHPTFEVALAISDERTAALAIRRFRERAGVDILVTCQMAYEGLDAKFATHMVYLSVIRTYAWMEQATARLTRFNPLCGLSWEKQAAKVFAPGDEGWQSFVERLKVDQGSGYDDHIEKALGPGPRRRSDFAPISATPTDTVVGGERGIPSAEVQAEVRELRAAYPGLQNMPNMQVIELAEERLAFKRNLRGTG